LNGYSTIMKLHYFMMLLLMAIALNSCEFGCSGIVARAKKLTTKGIVIGKYEMSTGCFGAIVVTEPSKWNPAKGRVNGTTEDVRILNETIISFERRAREVCNRCRPKFYLAVLPNGMSNFPSAIERSSAGPDANFTFPENVPETRVEVMSMTVTVKASFPYTR